MTNGITPTVATVTYFYGGEGHGIATTTLGHLTFKITFRMEDCRIVGLIEGRLVITDETPKTPCHLVKNETKLAMIVVRRANGLHAKPWGLVPEDHLADGAPADGEADKPAHKHPRKHPRKRSHKKPATSAEE